MVFTVGQQPEEMQTGGGLISDIGFSLSSYKIGMQNRQTMTGEFKKSHEVRALQRTFFSFGFLMKANPASFGSLFFILIPISLKFIHVPSVVTWTNVYVRLP